VIYLLTLKINFAVAKNIFMLITSQAGGNMAQDIKQSNGDLPLKPKKVILNGIIMTNNPLLKLHQSCTRLFFFALNIETISPLGEAKPTQYQAAVLVYCCWIF